MVLLLHFAFLLPFGFIFLFPPIFTVSLPSSSASSSADDDPFSLLFSADNDSSLPPLHPPSSSSPLSLDSSIQIPVNSSSKTPLRILGQSSVPISGLPGASISVECREPLMGAKIGWECGVEEKGAEERDEVPSAERSSSLWGEWEGMKSGESSGESSGGGGWSASMAGSREGQKGRRQRLFSASPLEVYYSNKVNQSNGNLFISALIRWQFRSALPRSAFYRIHLLVKQLENGSTEESGQMPKELDGIRHFIISLASEDDNDEDESSGRSSSSRQRSATSSANGADRSAGGGQRAELLLRIDSLFQFGQSYEIKILCTFDDDNNNEVPLLLPASYSSPSMEQNSAKYEGGGENGTILLGKARKRMTFANLFDEFDTEGCPDEDGFTQGPTSSAKLAARKAMASRWTGALRTVSFFPLHASINVSFFAAPPSHCIGAYRVQLWLMNALHEERIVEANQLTRADANVYIGSGEFRNLLMDHRLKYRIKVLPVEQSNGTCVCELERKCGCVQVYSDPFILLNTSDSIVDFLPPVIPFPTHRLDDIPSPPSPLPLLLAGLFLALTLVLLSIALLLLILRNSGAGARAKRRTLLVFRGKQQKDEEILVGGMGSKNCGSAAGGGSRKEVQSVLLVNAQPNRRNELERFARVLVKNGVRVFYDRWDRAKLEANMIRWVQEAVGKAQKTIFFYDSRAEQLLCPAASKDQNNSRDLFDQVFCALYQHLEPQKTIFVKWDESKLVDGRPLGALLLSENVFLFRRDLKLIFAALNVPTTEQDLKDIEREYGRGSTNSSLAVVVGGASRQQQQQKMKAKAEELRKLLTMEETEEVGEDNKKELAEEVQQKLKIIPKNVVKQTEENDEVVSGREWKNGEEEEEEEDDEGVGTTTTGMNSCTNSTTAENGAEHHAEEHPRVKEDFGKKEGEESGGGDSGVVISC